MVVRQERVGDNLEELQAILSLLGRLASEGQVHLGSSDAKALRVQIIKNVEFEPRYKLELEARNKEISDLKAKLKEVSLNSETQTWSQTDIVAQELVKLHEKTKKEHFEIPVLLNLNLNCLTISLKLEFKCVF